MTTTEDSFEAMLKGREKPDAEESTETKWGVFRRSPQPAVRIIDSGKRSWVIPMHWLDAAYEENGALVVKFTNGYTVTVEGSELFAPVHNSVIDAFQRQVMSLFRVGAPGVTSIVVEREE